MVAVAAAMFACSMTLLLAHESFPSSSKLRFQREVARGAFPLVFTSSLFWLPRPSIGAASIGSEQFLLRRLESYDASAYRPGLTISDIFYPKEFEGRWSASSRLVGFEAPMGEELFGGKGAIARAEGERGSALVYDSIFKATGDTVVADRLLNVESIARASMGPNSVLDDRQSAGAGSGIDRLHLTVSPSAAQGLLFDITLQVTDREQFVGPRSQLCALERTVQTIRSNRDNSTSSKAVETITSYSLDSSIVRARQRTATFWDADDSRYDDLIRQEPLLGKIAYDVRQYEVIYTRVA